MHDGVRQTPLTIYIVFVFHICSGEVVEVVFSINDETREKRQ